jgi:hypothetical protein
MSALLPSAPERAHEATVLHSWLQKHRAHREEVAPSTSAHAIACAPLDAQHGDGDSELPPDGNEAVDRHRKTVDALFDATDARVDLVYEHMAKQLGERFDHIEARLDLMYDTVLVQVEQASRRQGRVLTYVVLATGAVAVALEFAGLALWGWFA